MKLHAASLAHATAVLTFIVAFAPFQSAHAQDQTNKQPEMQVTLVGCVQREADYRKAQGIGRGGALGTGVGSATNVEYIPYHICSSKTVLHRIYHVPNHPSHLFLPVIANA